NKIGGDRTQMTLIYRIFADFFMEYTWENGVTTLSKNENFFYRAGAELGSWSSSSNKSDTCFLQSWGSVDPGDQLRHLLGSSSTSSGTFFTTELGLSWGVGAPASRLAVGR